MKNLYSWRKFKLIESKLSIDDDFLKFIIKNIKGVKKSFKVIQYKADDFKTYDKVINMKIIFMISILS